MNPYWLIKKQEPDTMGRQSGNERRQQKKLP